jgi:plasmid stability protein
MAYQNIAIDRELHSQVRIEAARKGVSIKKFAEDALNQALDGDGVDRIVAAYLADEITAQEAMVAIAASPAILGST